MSAWDAVETAVREAVGNDFTIHAYAPVGGGCINDAYRVTGAGEVFFVKLNRASQARMFADEAAGLAELRQGHRLRIPEPVCHGCADGRAFLVTEYVDMQPLNAAAMAQLGEGLAELHGIVRDRFGWDRDNVIGSTPQRNARNADWVEFWRENRLGFQLDLAAGDGARELAYAGDRLLTRLDELLADHRPEASLVHGDLWGGNVAMDAGGRPVLFDPAVYYGDRETDIAMTELFGGFSPLFFEAYHGAWPLEAGYRETRRELYQLYHLLNHHHLFGGHYGDEALACIRRLLACL